MRPPRAGFRGSPPCAASSATRAPARRGLFSSKVSSGSSTAATTPRASPRSPTAASRSTGRRASSAISSRSSPARSGRRSHRHRPHPLGHARPADGDQRPPADRLHRPDRRRAQRHLRELRGAQGGPREGRPPLQERDRHRGLRPRGRGRLPGRSHAAVRAAVRKLTGAYAVLVSSSREPGVLVTARSGPPIALGLGDGENYVASDPVALVPWTRDVIFLEDGDVARVDAEGRRDPQRRGRRGSTGRCTGSSGTPSPPRRAATATSWPRRSTSSRPRSPRRSAERSRWRPASSTSIRRS